MPNEVILIISVAVIFSITVFASRFFGENGLIAWNAVATVLANIEVLLLVRAFGMEQTLGNILFASTFLTTDILNEMYGKKAAARAVYISVAASVCFILISQSWLLYTPSADDWARESFDVIFGFMPRIVGASLVVYAVSQRFDVWLYAFFWKLTERKFKDKKPALWLSNCGSTLTSQLLNTVLFTLGAFWGVYEGSVLMSIMAVTFGVYVATSLLDTPFIYLARKLGKPRERGAASR